MDSDREQLTPRDCLKHGENDTAFTTIPYVVTRPPTQMQSSALVGPHSTLTACPFCYASVKTSIRYTSTTRTHTTAVRFCFIIPFCGCCLPHFMESTRNVDHYCPNCTRYLGTYEK